MPEGFASLAAIYYDFLEKNGYAFGMFVISREAPFNLTSITVNYSE